MCMIPWVDPVEARAEYGLELVESPDTGVYDAVLLAVAHDHFRELGAARLRAYGRHDHVLFDLKSVFQCDQSDIRI